MIANFIKEQASIYAGRNAASHRKFVEAAEVLPGGNSRSSVYVDPFPCYAEHGRNQYVQDIDGNRRTDFTNNMTSLILGHADPDVVKALQVQAGLGTAYAAPTLLEVEWARALVQRVPSLDKVRFANSGTEGTLNAIRAAKQFTGRPMVAKFEGGYHGTHDYVEFSFKPAESPRIGPRSQPIAVPDTGGVSEAIRSEVVILPFNDIENTVGLIRHYGRALACVIIEPVQGGCGILPATSNFLRALREVTSECGVILIFDEVIAFRITSSGAEGHYGVAPDLHAYGKIIGGGLPVGAVGGRADIMSVFDPRSGAPQVDHAGTFNANPMVAAAGLTTLTKYNEDAVESLNALGEELRRKLTELFVKNAFPACVTGVSSLFNFHFQATPPACYRDTFRNDKDGLKALFLWLHNNDVQLVARGMGCLSLPMTSDDVDHLVALVLDFIKRVR